MSIVYRQRGSDRQAFVTEVFQKLSIQKNTAGRNILLKPNIVSHEPYPTTTHLDMIQTCVKLLREVASKIIVAEGPAFDAGDPVAVIEKHPLKQTCDSLGVSIVFMMSDGVRKVKTASYELQVSELAFKYDYIISLPVLKSHGLGLTGALKNHLGFIPGREKLESHRSRDMSRVIAELHQIFKPRLYIVDAVQTLIGTNEIRHGGRPCDLGYMLAGTDPVALDIAGLELLKQVEPKLKGRQYGDIPQIVHAINLGIGEAKFEIVDI